jgi:hypothetical protein
MSLTTWMATKEFFNVELTFMQARLLIGIPAEQPFEVEPQEGDEHDFVRLHSEIGGFNSALDIYHGYGKSKPLFGDERPDEQDFLMKIRFDTQYGDDFNAGFFHRNLVTRMGDWFMSYGIEWWCETEANGWRHLEHRP